MAKVTTKIADQADGELYLHSEGNRPRKKQFGLSALLAKGAPIASFSLLLLALPAAAGTMQVGPFRLGMTNSQVVKVAPLRDCKVSDETVECESSLDILGNPTEAALRFNRSDKRLTRVHVRLSDWASDDLRLAPALADLKLAPCRPEMSGRKPDWFLKDECFEAPDQVRQVTWDAGRSGWRNNRGTVRSINIILQRHHGLYSGFKNEKAEQRKRERLERESNAFATGR